MAEFPVTLHHRDGRETVATNQRELVQARFDGFGEKPKKAKAESKDKPKTKA